FDSLDSRRLQPLDDLFGPELGGEIDVADGEAKQVVAHRAADIPGQAFPGTERLQDARDPLLPAPAGCVQLHAQSRRRVRLTIIAAVAPQMRRPCQSIW